MCDTLIDKNIPEDKFPEYVYKRVQKVGEGKYLSPVMGQPMTLGKWQKAPSRNLETLLSKSSYPAGKDVDLVRVLNRQWKKKIFASSSAFSHHHNGMWGSFKYRTNAKQADMTSNFVDPKKHDLPYPTVVVKCQVKGIVHKGLYTGKPSFLSSHIMIVEEIKTVNS